MKRLYAFEKIFNFRDFGGYKTQSGQMIRSEKLFRSANFHRASALDLSHLSDLDIGLLVDLRYAPERDRQPNKWPAPSSTKVLSFEDLSGTREADIAPHEAFMKTDLRVAEDARNYMLNSYKTRPGDPGFEAIFSDTLRHMADTGDNIVIHCAAGKDRTGTLAAIILSVLGVDIQTIIEDYMLTMSAVDIESFLAPAAEMMKKRHKREFTVDSLRPMFGVEPDYLESSLQAIGNMSDYVRDNLRISDSDIEAIKADYLVS